MTSTDDPTNQPLALVLREIGGRFAVVRLAAEREPPSGLFDGARTGLLSVTRTDQELSIVCDERLVALCGEPQAVERDFVAFCVDGQLDLSLTGVLARLVDPLRTAAVSVFAVSTFDTDWILVRQRHRERARLAWREAGIELAG